ncbi:hypothetical protein ACQKGD_10765 [Peribacillus frigoritolerans]|uniref:hypothetical protein n=1 Tax=Peribacillus frigoritolerans TaxID=450367 RepID=UPI003D0266C8
MQVIINGITPVSVETYADGAPIAIKSEHIQVDFTLKNGGLILKGEVELTGDLEKINLSLPSLRETVLNYVKESF